MPEPAAWSRELEPNPAFTAEFDRVSGRCTFLEAKDLMSCPTSERDALRAKIHELGPSALETLLIAMASPAPRSKKLAGMQLRGAFERSLGPSLAQAPIPPRVVSALIAALEELPISDAMHVASVATFVATREGRLEAVMQIMERRPELKSSILPRIMRYGRMQAFDEVKKWAASMDEETVLSALEALRLMEDWTADECAQIGPWLDGFLDDASNKVQGKAGALLLYCGDDRAARGLGWFDSAHRGKRLTRDTIFAYGRHCQPDDHATLAREKLAQLAASPLCVKIEKKLDRVAADQGSEGGLREAALQSLTGIWPKTALPRARTLTAHKDEHLAQTARNVVKLLGDNAK